MTKPAQAALSQLCQEARELLEPQLDAATIETRVLEQVRRSAIDSRVVPCSRTMLESLKAYLLPTALVAAAAVALVWTHSPSQPPTEATASHRGQLANEPWTDGTVLGVGQVVDAHDHDVTIKHPGIATWRLSTPGRARVVEQGERITVALELGAIEAEVVPRPQAEVFAVEVEHIRVAVHGTVFAVERRGNEAAVVVSEGSVRLGTSDQRGSTHGEILTAPARVSIDVSPEDSTSRGNRRSTPQRRALLRGPTTIEHQDAGVVAAPIPTLAAAAAPELAETPSIAEAERLWEAVDREVSLCFAGQPKGDPNVRVSFGTRIGVLVSPDGSVAVTSFDPPIAEPVYLCTAQQVANLQTKPTKSGAFMLREKILMR